MMLYLNLSNLSFEIPIYNKTMRHIIPPRCESIRKININISEPSVVLQQQIDNGLFIANSIIDPHSCYIRVLNTTDKPIATDLNNLQIKPLSEFSQINTDIQNNPFDASRINKLVELIHKTHSGKHLSKLTTLITEYADIFSVSGDIPTTNNFYEQKLKLKSDSSDLRIYKKLPASIFTKNRN